MQHKKDNYSTRRGQQCNQTLIKQERTTMQQEGTTIQQEGDNYTTRR